MSMISKVNEETTIDLLEVLKTLWRKAWLIILCGVLGAIIAFGITKFAIKPTYRTRITVYVNNRVEEGKSLSQGDLNAAAKLVDTYSAIIRSDTVMGVVAEQTGVSLKPGTVRSKVSAQAVNNTEVFNVYVTDTDPVRAANIANGIADVFPGIVSEIVSGSSAKIIDRATVPTERYSPSYKRNTLLGAAAGLFAMAAIILVRAFLDDSITGPSDLESLGYPLLAVIPDLESGNASSGGYGYAYASSRNRAKKTSQGTASEDGKPRAAL
ncbi:MAG: hypothetical protein IJR95_03760 [Lachnospiraceae bacterium]|nr:hypothetical protein [Lachnospiraceae bacterium]